MDNTLNAYLERQDIRVSMPLVSVIMPVYNVEAYLKESIESIRHQKLENIEIICVNDGSTDNSHSILEKEASKDKRIKIVEQENKGLSEARNTGIREAKGEYLFFIDSDDTLEKDALELLTERMTIHKLDMILFNAKAFGNDEKSKSRANGMNVGYFKRELDEKEILSGVDMFYSLKEKGMFIAPVWSEMIRRDVVIKNDLFFHPGILHEDEPWTFKALATALRVGCVNDVLYNYRIRSGAITSDAFSFMHIYGLFSGIRDIQKTIEDSVNKNDKRITDCGIKHVVELQEAAINNYRLCDENEKNKRYNMKTEELTAFSAMIAAPADMLDKEERKWTNSKSYQIGKFILSPFRKCKSLIEENKENGRLP